MLARMAGQKSSSDLDTIYHGNAERVPRGSDLRHMSAPSGPPNGIGQPVRRKEDVRLLTGSGHYGDDLALPRMVHAAFVRSPHAHARIRSMDKTAALAVPGALAVLGRPVKWTCERSESFLSDYQGRDLRVEAELALDADGTFLAVRSSHLSNLGAYATTFVPLQKGMGILSAVYHIPVAFVRGRGAFTNTAPTAPYRSAGRPEVIFVIERLIDLAADRLALDPVALRQRNLIPSAAQPYTNPLGLIYDSGDYEQVMERALALADWQGFPARRAEVRRRGKWRGIGIANFV